MNHWDQRQEVVAHGSAVTTHQRSTQQEAEGVRAVRRERVHPELSQLEKAVVGAEAHVQQRQHHHHLHSSRVGLLDGVDDVREQREVGVADPDGGLRQHHAHRRNRHHHGHRPQQRRAQHTLPQVGGTLHEARPPPPSWGLADGTVPPAAVGGVGGPLLVLHNVLVFEGELHSQDVLVLGAQVHGGGTLQPPPQRGESRDVVKVVVKVVAHLFKSQVSGQAHRHQLCGLLVNDIHGPSQRMPPRHGVRCGLHHQYRVGQLRVGLLQRVRQLSHVLFTPFEHERAVAVVPQHARDVHQSVPHQKHPRGDAKGVGEGDGRMRHGGEGDGFEHHEQHDAHHAHGGDDGVELEVLAHRRVQARRHREVAGVRIDLVDGQQQPREGLRGPVGDAPEHGH
mmetsp:Transcript_13000/g.24801  ORF Transcript_13000/g.24801 Transcript_13000/m.24801 type:complete len:394 (+) Transcript_13000:749-1930(+)